MGRWAPLPVSSDTNFRFCYEEERCKCKRNAIKREVNRGVKVDVLGSLVDVGGTARRRSALSTHIRVRIRRWSPRRWYCASTTIGGARSRHGAITDCKILITIACSCRRTRHGRRKRYDGHRSARRTLRRGHSFGAPQGLRQECRLAPRRRPNSYVG